MAKGQLINDDFKTEAEIVTDGGTVADLLNAVKVYVALTGGTLETFITNLQAALVVGVFIRPGIIATKAAPLEVDAVIDLTSQNTFGEIQVFVVGNAGGVPGPTVLTRSQITNAGFTGQRLMLIGTDDTNTVEISDGINGPVVLGAGKTVEMFWDGTELIETGRNQ